MSDVEIYSHDVLILGTGLAGLRAAVEIARKSDDSVNMALVSKVQLMRAHSVCAEGGTAAVLREEEGDSFELHAWDTIKGSDFLADQDVVDLFVRKMPDEIRQLEHWGVPWTRRDDGRIDQRPFGGHSYPRATLAADKTGFFEMQGLYDTLLKYQNFDRYEEVFATSFLIDDGKIAGITAIDMPSGKFIVIKAKAVLIATGGLGTLYGFTTYSQTVSGDGQAMAYKAGMNLEDLEFIQFHPTGLVPSGILMTEGCRGEGGYLRDKDDNRFMEKYAAKFMETAPRDIVSRSETTEILEGRGIPSSDGGHHLQLDLIHLGAEKINKKLPLIRELCMKFLGIDPIFEQIPIRPVAHYSMGGIETDIMGKTGFSNTWAAGEVACVSLHGANRLGSNSTAECLVWGGICGEEIVKYLKSGEAKMPEVDDAAVKAEADNIFNDLLKRDGSENPYDIRKDLRDLMGDHMGVYRTGELMQEGLEKTRALIKRFENIKILDKGLSYNTNLMNVIELENLLMLAEAAIMAALAREESRGGHARRDFPTRDDDKWLKHTLIKKSEEGPALSYKGVTIDKWKPVERKY
jgi:succinate dehydrogenase / fumarate reductase flavoprotein subunit